MSLDPFKASFLDVISSTDNLGPETPAAFNALPDDVKRYALDASARVAASFLRSITYLADSDLEEDPPPTPIERLFAMGWALNETASHCRPCGVVILTPQRHVEAEGRAFRVDFELSPLPRGVGGYFDVPRALHFGVELDGHAFHERTKEQARKDKERQRILQSAGWTLVRYTGSEVVRDPAAVAMDARRRLATWAAALDAAGQVY